MFFSEIINGVLLSVNVLYLVKLLLITNLVEINLQLFTILLPTGKIYFGYEI